MSEWQPIETAPKDGRDQPLLLLWEPHDAGGFCFVGCLDRVKGGYFNNLDFGDQHPTHWMPLPEPPAA